jgi:hypothetical protein
MRIKVKVNLNIMAELLLGFLLMKEMTHYSFYNRLLEFVRQKKYFKIEYDKPNPIQNQWFEKCIMEKLTDDELKILLRNSFSYNTNNHSEYYVPIELSDIPRKKMIKWLSYNIYFQSLWQFKNNEIGYAEKLLDKIEARLDIQFPDIDDNDIYFLKFGNNKIECKYRPTIVRYSLTILKDMCYFALRLTGFQKFYLQNFNITYFYYENSKEKKTIFFFHGLGFGIEPYLYYLLSLREKANLVIIILPNISNMEYLGDIKNITYDSIFPENESWRIIVKSIVIKHSISRMNFIGHSFGTIIMGILMKDEWILNRLDRKVFIEPVCFYEKSYKTYRYINEPKEGNYGMISKIFNVLIYSDVFLRYATQRFLYGPEFWILDYDELSQNSFVILSEKDQVVPTDELYEIMKSHEIKCVCLKDAYHADMFMSDKYNNIYEEINKFILNP